MSISSEATNLAALLFCLTQPDTEGIRKAEATLKPLLRNPNCVTALFEILFARGGQVSDKVLIRNAMPLFSKIS